MRGSQLRKQLIYTVSIHICRMLNGMQNECPIFFSEGGIISEIPHVLWIASLRQRERDQYSDYLRLEMVACWHWFQGWWTGGNHHVPLIWQSNLCSIESSRTVNSPGVGSCCPFQLPLTQTIDTRSHFLERFCWLRPPSLKSYKVLAQTCRRRWRREIVGMKHWFISSRFRWIWNSLENFHQDGKNMYIYIHYIQCLYITYTIYIYICIIESSYLYRFFVGFWCPNSCFGFHRRLEDGVLQYWSISWFTDKWTPPSDSHRDDNLVTVPRMYMSYIFKNSMGYEANYGRTRKKTWKSCSTSPPLPQKNETTKKNGTSK